MSRALPPPRLKLWRYDTTIQPFTVINELRQLMGDGSAQRLVEFLMIENDVASLDFVAIGFKTSLQSLILGTSYNCITQLQPGESVIFEPEHHFVNGKLIATRDGDFATVLLEDDLEKLDAATLWGLSGPTIAGASLHITIGSSGG